MIRLPVAVLLLLGAVVAASAQEIEMVDRVVAVVDEDPILQSDLDRVIALGLAEQARDEEPEAFQRRVLDGLIEQKLRFHEIDRYGFATVPLEEVEEQFELLRRRLGGEAEMIRQLDKLDLDSESVRQVLARQLMVLVHVEERLGPRVLIGFADIQAYYDETLVPELEGRGASVPPIEDVREQVRNLLREQRLDEEIELWTEELRLEADVEDYLESEHEELPPVVVDRRE